MLSKIIRNFIAKRVAGRSDDGIMITLTDPKKVDFQSAMLEDFLMRNGIDPRAITSEAQLKGILNQIEAMTKQSTTSGIRNVESAKVFDLEGKQIPPGSKIMGGKAIDDLPPPGSRGGPDDIAAPVQSSEESLKNMIEAENKKGIAKIKQRQKMLDDAIEDASPGFANDIKYDAEIVAENLAERMGLVYDDLPTKQRLDLYDKAYTGLSKKRFKQRESLEDFVDDAGGVDESDPRGIDDFIPDPEDMAKGGRVGLKSGSDLLESLGFTPEHSAAVADMDKDFSGSQFDYAAASTKDMVDRASNPVTAAISAAGNVVARPVYDFVDAAKEYSKKGYQGEFSFTPQGIVDFGKNLASLGKEFVNQKPLTMMTGAAKGGLEGVIDRFTTQETPIDPTSKNLFTQYYEEDPYAGIEGQTALLDPFTVIGGLTKIAKGAKASALAKEFLKQKAKQKIGKEIYDKIQKKITTPKYPKTTTKPGTGRGPPGTTTTKSKSTGGSNPYGGGSGGIHSGMKSSSAPTNVGNPFGYMDGGRIGLKDGMNRRTFLKLFSGLVALPVIGKVLKPLKVGKTVTKVPIIKTDNVAGKPEWFDQLVNKVILEGDDVSKRFATKDREIVHIKKLDEDTNIMVTQDLDEGVVRVDYESPESMYGDPVGLQYKKPLPDEGDPRPGAEFDTTESIPVARADGPDDYAIEIDEGGGQSISDLVSDVSKLKQYATGQKPTLKEFVQSKKRKDQVKKISEGDREAETDFVINRQGEPIIDMEPDIDDVFATGGLARLKYQMGGDVAYDATNQDIYGSSAATFTPDTVMDQFGNQVQAEKGNNFNKPLIPQVTEQASKQEGIMNSSPVVSQSDGTGEIDMPIAGGNNNAGGILPVMPGDPPPAGILPVMPDKPAQPTMSDEDIMKGFEEFKKQNPDIMSGPATQAIVNLTLPGGTPISFRSGAGAYALRQYLKSIGMEAGPGKELFEPLKTAGPASRVDLNAVSPLAKTALANGGIARMLGE